MENYYGMDEVGTYATNELNEKSFVCGLDGLLRVLTKTMVKKGATENEIAKMQKHVCAQFGIDVGEEFINVSERNEIDKEYRHFNDYFYECIVADVTKRTDRGSVYYDYLDWAKKKDCSVVLTRNRFYNFLRGAGIIEGRSSGMRYFGLSIIHN